MINRHQNLASLSPEKRALLEARLRQRSGLPETREISPSTPNDQPRPLSFAQETFWFFDQLAPGSPLYNIPQAFCLTGKLNADALQKSFEALIQRHEILRTKFVSLKGKPVQIVRREWEVPFSVTDLRALSLTERQAEVQRHLSTEAQRPFDLANDLLLRASLLRTTDDEHILLLTIHHIAADAWSLKVLNEELEKLYAGFCSGNASALPQLPCQYGDFAVCQRERLSADGAARQIAYWKQQLAGDPPPLELPTDRPRPATKTFRGWRKEIVFPAALLASLKELSRKEGITLYAILLAAVKILLHRYSGQTDILIGSPVGARHETQAEKLIGVFLNTVVLRTGFSDEPAFRQLAHRVSHTVLNAIANKDVPLERLVEELKIARDPARNPLFQVVFQFFPEPPQLPRLQDIQVSRLPMETGTAKFDLTLTLAEDSTGLVGDLEYNTDLFVSETIDRMISHLQMLLEGIAANPDRKVTHFSLMTKAEERELLLERNLTDTDYPRNAAMAELFEAQVERTPHVTALVFEGQHVSYQDLNRRANQLAHYLQDLGVRPKTRIAVCLERSIELVVSLLAILKAGGAYVPLDMRNPVERLNYMIEDTAASVLITTASLRQSTFSSFSGQVICIDHATKALEFLSHNNLNTSVTAENLAYVMYTSGSTGQPKGVAIPQRGVVRLVSNPNYLQISADDVFLLFAPVSFDASTLEIWGPLLNGATLAIFPPKFTSLKQLGDFLEQQKITVLWLTAGLFHQMVEENISSLKGVRKLLAGGDVLSVPHVMKALHALPETELINGYGPTENTTFTCCYSIPRDWNGRSVPIGKPISNTQVYILDKHRNPVPTGVPGELYIGGDGLAREYLNAPELNREKFVQNTLIPSTSPRLYRTGDLVRWLPDGNLEFLGRMDNQVKIRGFRVELDEIENAIAQHPDVRQCAVITREDNTNTKQLFAYFVPRPGKTVTADALRALLASKLPVYMVPAHFIAMEKLPLTTNGKIDRKALPTTEVPASPNETTQPRNADEETLLKIWSDVLNRNQISIHDDFFYLGGHSLLATRVVSRINEVFAADISLQAIFEHSTIAKLAELVAREKDTAVRQQILPRRGRSQTTTDKTGMY